MPSTVSTHLCRQQHHIILPFNGFGRISRIPRWVIPNSILGNEKTVKRVGTRAR